MQEKVALFKRFSSLFLADFSKLSGMGKIQGKIQGLLQHNLMGMNGIEMPLGS